MPFLELLLLRLLLWIGLPVALVVLAVGPGRVGRWIKKTVGSLFDRRLEPAEVLNRVVAQHQRHINDLKKVLSQAEAARNEIVVNRGQSEKNIATLEAEAASAVKSSDDLAARAALYRLNLEKLAVDGFNEQIARQDQRIDQTKKRLYVIELQLRQFEVGRTVLLSQLAEAKTVEQQFALANQFDPFSAVAEWQRTEGFVQEKTKEARAIEHVYEDTADMPIGRPLHIDAEVLDQQLAELKGRVKAGRRNGQAVPEPE